MTDELLKAFEYGVDYGLLLAEQERDSEDMADSVACMMYSKKMCVPSTPIQRRQPRSDKWRLSKRQSVDNFIKLYAEYAKSRR